MGAETGTMRKACDRHLGLCLGVLLVTGSLAHDPLSAEMEDGSGPGSSQSGDPAYSYPYPYPGARNDWYPPGDRPGDYPNLVNPYPSTSTFTSFGYPVPHLRGKSRLECGATRSATASPGPIDEVPKELRIQVTSEERAPGPDQELTFAATLVPAAVRDCAFEWTFGDGAAATGAKVRHTYSKPGLYATGLTVTSPAGDWRWIESLTVDVAAPAGQLQRLTFAPGWNLFSVTGQPVDDYPSAELRTQGLASASWHKWNGTGYTYAYDLEPTRGYWLRHDGEQPLSVDLRVLPQKYGSVVLQPGWNLLAPVAPCPRPTDPRVLSAWGWSAVEQVYTPLRPAQSLVPGRAYWIYAETSFRTRLDGQPGDGGRLVVCFGDSLTSCGGPGGRFSDILQERFPAHTFLNRGFSGATLADALRRLDGDVLSLTPDLVLLEFGANDWRWNGRTPDQWARDLEELVVRLRRAGSQVVILGVFGPHWDANHRLVPHDLNGDGGGTAFRMLESQIALDYNCGYLPNIQEFIKGRGPYWYWQDSSHPSERGNRYVAHTIAPVLAAFLRVPPQPVRLPQ